MTEAELKMAREYVDLHFPSEHWSPYYRGDNERSFLAGYLAGQQSLWREYPKEKPQAGKKVVVCDGTSGHWHTAFLDNDIFIDGRGGYFPEVTHWMPITLPATK